LVTIELFLGKRDLGFLSLVWLRENCENSKKGNLQNEIWGFFFGIWFGLAVTEVRARKAFAKGDLRSFYFRLREK
jgi:hypothetical protein